MDVVDTQPDTVGEADRVEVAKAFHGGPSGFDGAL
jgi:hypothetical protein